MAALAWIETDLATGVIVVTGEPCPPATAARWSAGHRVVHVYAPAVTGPAACADSAVGDDPSTLGLPIAGARLEVLDSHQRRVRPSAPGELYVSGVRTGDIVRARADGCLDLIGRTGRLLRRRGFRVAPVEIERAASRVTGVAAAAVFDIPEADRPALGLAVVPAGRDPRELESAIRSTLEQTLPDYLVPTHVIAVDRIPITVAGLRHDAALAVLCIGSADAAPTAEPPSTPHEQLVAAIWQEVLRRPVLSVDDNFFDLGGHSLLATKVLLAIHKKTGVKMPIRQLFTLRTVRALAAELEASASSSGGPA
ncbi:MAG: tycC3 [Mycobacterium sp.]|nr:tycC3 [Mycobacterium sp.]